MNIEFGILVSTYLKTIAAQTKGRLLQTRPELHTKLTTDALVVKNTLKESKFCLSILVIAHYLLFTALVFEWSFAQPLRFKLLKNVPLSKLDAFFIALECRIKDNA